MGTGSKKTTTTPNKKKKMGKGRLDSFYHMAKEHGFRSRAAFKLIQLNKKYNFLGNSRSLVDLCAAPGGWLQVAVKHMPVASVIIGVDLQEIKPIRNVISFQDDITKASCSKTIHGHLKGNKVEVVLHDGAPNMGTAWAQDAYDQSDLTLKALRLATQVLKKDGWFITKVFRSPDYNALLWVFNQLFKKVDSTKPMASRNTSAEIYVVCSGYLAPTKIDPKLLDPIHIFKTDHEGAKKSTIQDLGGEKRRQRQGYNTTASSLFTKSTVSDFVKSSEPIQVLADNYTIEFDDESAFLKDLPETTLLVKKAFEDLKVLNRNEFKNLLKWRMAAIAAMKRRDQQMNKEEEADDEGDDADEKGGDEEEEEEQDDLEQMNSLLTKRARKEKKRALERKRKKIKAAQLGMTTEEGSGLGIQDNNKLFEIGSLTGLSSEQLAALADAKITEKELQLSDDEVDEEVLWNESDKEDDTAPDYDDEAAKVDKLERDLDLSYDLFVRSKRGKKNGLVAKDKLDKSTVTTHKEYNAEGDDEIFEDEEQDDKFALKESKKNLLVMKPSGPSNQQKIDSWFEQDIFAGLAGVKKEEDDYNMMDAVPASYFEEKKKRKIEQIKTEEPTAKKIKTENVSPAVGPTTPSATTNGTTTTDKTVKKRVKEIEDAMLKSDTKKKQIKEKRKKEAVKQERKNSKKSKDGDSKEFEVVPQEPDLVPTSDQEEEDADMKMEEDDDVDDVRGYESNKNMRLSGENDHDNLDDEDQVTDDEEETNKKIKTLAIGTALLRKKAQETAEDDMFNRYTFNDEDLPDWFVADEDRYIKPILPITKEEVQAIKDRVKEIDSRPIKKVAEARARKQRRQIQSLAKARAKANSIVKDDTLTAGQKISQVNKIMKKATQKKGKEKVYMVSKKGKTNPRHAKLKKSRHARVKMVDPRMKKDTRARAAGEKASKGKSKGAKPKKSGSKGKSKK
eukprot:TRINITY_DN4974_c0_g1_i1.p1 TRINITY_DN4974_c0_g1~~TRINITY_DN4974_c0_g1_i1.p1  ORF type:complete len:958 (+),score=367.05 TRINITY_DN4974_c0_g1_i1:185-3058(+)